MLKNNDLWGIFLSVLYIFLIEQLGFLGKTVIFNASSYGGNARIFFWAGIITIGVCLFGCFRGLFQTPFLLRSQNDSTEEKKVNELRLQISTAFVLFTLYFIITLVLGQ